MYYENGEKVFNNEKDRCITRVRPDGSMVFDMLITMPNGEVLPSHKETPPNPALAFDPAEIPAEAEENIATFDPRRYR